MLNDFKSFSRYRMDSLIFVPNINILGGNFSQVTLVGDSSILVEITQQNGGII